MSLHLSLDYFTKRDYLNLSRGYLNFSNGKLHHHRFHCRHVCVCNKKYILCFYMLIDICSTIKMPRYKYKSLLVIITRILFIKIKLYRMRTSNKKIHTKKFKGHILSSLPYNLFFCNFNFCLKCLLQMQHIIASK